ncbi:hypothetical protein PACTADRAFT_35041 [Pachysolen tannophilus NRRL Y-2460]|uniref:Uncharacterized protein n=1 Tax=Pachysolen tannophilus NRRL Y-2460 TaxID=669874 RepID=A0A1E4TR55_PACTA|nr:hypothetical protein PACTADRAFT_35041 [Pachysolen tannophilus NRRL Y-2460]
MRVSLDDIYSGKNRSEIKYGNPRDEFEAILADDKIREAYLLAIGNRQDNITSSSQVLDTLTSLDHDPAKILNDLIGGWVSNYKQKIIQQNDLENSFKNLKIKEIKDRKDNVGKMFMDDLSNFIKDQDNEIDSVILRIQEEKKMKELQRQKLIAEKEQKKKEEERKEAGVSR